MTQEQARQLTPEESYIYAAMESYSAILRKERDTLSDTLKVAESSLKMAIGLKDDYRKQLEELRKERDYWKQRCEAAEEMYRAAEQWWNSEMSLDGFEKLSSTFEKHQQIKSQNQ